MIFDARNVEASSALNGYDVCIVGGGAAGLTLAKELSRGTAKICLLESGGLEYDDDTQSLYRGPTNSTAYQDIEYNRLRFLGGTTNHWSGSCRPLDPIDFESRSWVPNSGWPFDRAHLDPFYARAHKYCDLSEFNYGAEYWRKKSGLKRLPIDEMVAETAIFQHSLPTRFGEKYKADIERNKNLDVYLHANVTNIQLNELASDVDKLDVQVLNGDAFSVSAQFYIIALGGIENARILLLSDGVMQQGVGNGNDLVGKYFMDHPVAKGAIFMPTIDHALFNQYLGPTSPRENVSAAIQLHRSKLEKEGLLNFKFPFIPVTKFYASEGVEAYHALSRAIGPEELHGDLWTHIKNMAGDFDMVLEGMSRRLFGTKFFDSADDEGFYVFDTMMESPPEESNRVKLDTERDALGQRRVSVKFRVANSVRENFWRVFRMIAAEFGKAGIGRVRLLESQGPRIWGGLINYGSHHIGTTRAHVNSKRGVVDANLRVHGISNLYMAGSSVFPTGGHVPPTLTIVALAIRLAQHLKDRYGV